MSSSPMMIGMLDQQQQQPEGSTSTTPPSSTTSTPSSLINTTPTKKKKEKFTSKSSPNLYKTSQSSVPSSPGGKIKSFFSKINSSPIKNKSPRNAEPSSPTISRPFALSHVTHINFDPNSRELQGLPNDWGKTLKKSVSKLVSVRKDSTAARHSVMLQQTGLSSSAPQLHIDSNTNTTLESQSISVSSITPPLPTGSSNLELSINSDKLKLYTPEDLASSTNNLNSPLKRPKSNIPPISSLSNNNNNKFHHIRNSTPISSLSINNNSSSNNNLNNRIINTQSISSSPNLSNSSNSSPIISSPVKLSYDNQSPSSPSLLHSYSSSNFTPRKLDQQTNSKSLDNLVIGNPTYLRREIHITWNHVTGQFEGVPPEWQLYISEVSSDKQKKKRMEMRKRLILDESHKFDKEERSRRLIRDRCERARLLKEERRRSMYVPRNNKDDPIPIPSSIVGNDHQPLIKSYSVPNYSLWQISGTQVFKTKRIELSINSLCINDVFILDSGKTIYCWMGEQSSLQKQVRACSIANKIKYENQFIIEPIKIEILMQNESHPNLAVYESFFNLLKSNNQISSSTNFLLPKITKLGQTLDSVLSEEESQMTWLYRVSDNGKITTMEERPILPTILNSNTCFILDCETDIFVWNGKYSHPLKQKVAVIFAKEFLNIFSDRPQWASLHIVHQGEEPWLFKERFLYWLEDECIVDNLKRNTFSLRSGSFSNGSKPFSMTGGPSVNNPMTPVPMPIDQNFLVSDLFTIPDHYNKKLNIDNNNEQYISLDIWKSEGNSWKKVPTNLHGHFESNQCYVCHHVFKVNGKFQSRAYFWQGAEASIKWWIVFQFGLYKELDQHMQTLGASPPPTECLTQNKESHQFLNLFKNIFIHHPSPVQANNSNNTESLPHSSSGFSISSMSSLNSGAISASPSMSSNGSNFSLSQLASKTTLYVVSMIANTYVRTCQFQDFDISNFNSRDLFIFHSFAAKTMFVWAGKGCLADLKLVGNRTAQSIHQYYQSINEIARNDFNLVIEFDEGKEPPIFWKLFLSSSNVAAQNITNMPLEQKRTFYSYDPYFEVTHRLEPKLFHIFYHPKVKTYVINKVNPFCQGDLCEEDAFILDAFYKIYIWTGPSCSDRKKDCAFDIAKQYIQESNMGHFKDTEILFIEAGEEDIDFKSYFPAWSNHLTLSNWRNNSQSLIGAGADHRLLNSIVTFGAISADSMMAHDSGDESMDSSPISISPASASPPIPSILANVKDEPLESWEIQLESEMDRIRKKRYSPQTSPKLSSFRHHHEENLVDTNQKFLLSTSINHPGSPLKYLSSPVSSSTDTTPDSSPLPSPHITTSMDQLECENDIVVVKQQEEEEDDEFEQDEFEQDDEFNDIHEQEEYYQENGKPISSPVRKLSNSQQLYSISPGSRNKLLELAQINCIRYRKRGTSVLGKKPSSPIQKPLTPPKDRIKSVLENTKSFYGGSIDAKSLKELKADFELDKIEYELSQMASLSLEPILSESSDSTSSLDSIDSQDNQDNLNSTTSLSILLSSSEQQSSKDIHNNNNISIKPKPVVPPRKDLVQTSSPLSTPSPTPISTKPIPPPASAKPTSSANNNTKPTPPPSSLKPKPTPPPASAKPTITAKTPIIGEGQSVSFSANSAKQPRESIQMIQRTSSVKEKIFQCETIVKNIADSVQKTSPKLRTSGSSLPTQQQQTQPTLSPRMNNNKK
ncbi:hypothetical protein CYY_007004 [Polysphondylium violaceum]|uniref:CRIB domain-containing protein n=1 Tax=Polysphondylium violaceum TaxID=133409 RepID=A0A8J4UR62_9MYCE|nr:hypothetical protein CYY_007004 [Polysphondylium violaceum]